MSYDSADHFEGEGLGHEQPGITIHSTGGKRTRPAGEMRLAGIERKYLHLRARRKGGVGGGKAGDHVPAGAEIGYKIARLYSV